MSLEDSCSQPNENLSHETLVDLDELSPTYLDTNLLLEFPKPDRHGICLVTEDMPLQLLYSAYMGGVFPWFNEDDGEPVVWYSPNPRFCLKMDDLHVPKSVDRFLKHTPYRYTMDKDFRGVIESCRNMTREGQNGTWIGQKIIDSYCAFFDAGFAHSVEVWDGDDLVGGFYGVLMGSVFCGESMFTVKPDSSKSAFVLFARVFKDCGGKLIDSQVYTDNMARYGATNISRDAFLRLEDEYLFVPLKSDLKESFEKMVSVYGG